MQIVTTHKNTDFDGFASVVAATLIYPDAVPVLPKQLNPNVKAFLSLHKDLFKYSATNEINFDNVKRLVVVDTNAWHRLDRMTALADKEALEIYLWDHHTASGDIQAQWRCQETMGANVTLMIRQLKEQGVHLTPIQSTLLLAGIYEDTGNLTFPSSKAEDAYAAAFLLEHKADLSVLNSFLRPAYGQIQKNILFEMIKDAERIKVNGYTISINTCAISGHAGNLSVVVNMYRDILNVDAAFGIFPNTEHDRCIVIGRSSIEGIDIGAIMRSMGGGGHPGAGSVLRKSVATEAVEKEIIDLIEGNQQAAAQVSDLMSFPVLTVQSDTSMEAVAGILREKGCTGVPVVEGEKLVGIISRRDFRRVKKESQLSSPVKAFMSRVVQTVEPGTGPMLAARLMVKHDIGRLPVVEDDKIIGIVTRSDTMRYYYDLLPE
jgi:nanoRNase/pAp phosphatase (c-di-AMP/oligoRNAs hydrolase)